MDSMSMRMGVYICRIGWAVVMDVGEYFRG